MKYKAIPIVVEAMQYNGTPMRAVEMEEWSSGFVTLYKDAKTFSIATIDHVLKVGDWLIKYPDGSFSIRRDDLFQASFTPHKEKTNG
jgi:acyl-coenzyme A synthetase/AMP-(fatty) acid ligase